MHSRILLLVLAALLTPALADEGHQHAMPAGENFGTVHFATSCSAAAQPKFQRAVAILHSFGYEHARATRTAWEAYAEGKGVCRDYAHLAVAFCRCMNIPARYVNGYLGDIGVPQDPAPMDFSAWMEVYLDGKWYTFDPRHNKPRIGRILVARGRDATDVALSTAFGTARLAGFKVVTDEIVA